MGQFIHAIQVGCDNCSGLHLTKDYDLDENGNQKDQACCSSGYRYDEDQRKPKKQWKAYKDYIHDKEDKYRHNGFGFYQEHVEPEKKTDFQSMRLMLP